MDASFSERDAWKELIRTAVAGEFAKQRKPSTLDVEAAIKEHAHAAIRHAHDRCIDAGLEAAAKKKLDAAEDALRALMQRGPVPTVHRDDVLLGRLTDWCFRYGDALKPTAGSADSFGDGMRAAKEQVRALLDAHAAQPPQAPGGEGAASEAEIEAWRKSATMDPCKPPGANPDGPYAIGYWLAASEIDEAVALMRRGSPAASGEEGR